MPDVEWRAAGGSSLARRCIVAVIDEPDQPKCPPRQSGNEFRRRLLHIEGE
jgi:hypothetical protein